MQNGQKSTIPTMLLWVIAAGAGTGGLTGIGALDQLAAMSTSLEEQVRQAERRGELQAEIVAIRRVLDRHEVAIGQMMPNTGIVKLHDTQQNLIDKLIDFTNDVVTKTELELTVKKLHAQIGARQ